MISPKFSNPAYRIETKRLVVRCYDPSDAPLLAESVSENVEHLRPWMPWAYSEPEPMEEKFQRLKRFRGLFDLGQDFVYGIFNPEETKLVGGTGLHTRLGDGELEIGYWIHKDYINQGLVTESTAALIKVAFELLRVHRIEIHMDAENAASAAIPRKLGFTHEGTLRGKLRFLDNWRDTMIWGLLESEYPKSPSAEAEIKAFDADGQPVL
ncbi:MAG TPA: GNAT family protein [Anaerolineales bacterium]|jgi:RimJ/RimL family protein N-acetyltransferase|nr:GNAT family protein [Anaerolineales bacterium]